MYKPFKRIILVFILLSVCLTPFLSAAESLKFSGLTVFPSDKKHTAAAEKLKDGIIYILDRDYGSYLSIKERGRTEYTVSLNLYSDETQDIITLKLTSGSGSEKTFSAALTPSYDTPMYLAGTVFYLWSSFHGYLKETTAGPPLFVDALRTEYLTDTVIPEMNTPLIPLDIAATESGNFLAAFSMISVEFDRHFKVLGQPGRSLFEKGNYTSSAGIGVTPEGTVVLKPSMGRYLYKVPLTGNSVTKIRSGGDLYGPFTVLRDGSIILLDIQKKKAYRLFDRRRKELNLFTGPYSYVSALKTGPEGNIWIYDLSEKRIRIHSPEGGIIDSIVPVIDESTGSPVDFSVYSDGRFIVLYSTGTLAEFNREGIPLWISGGYDTPYGRESFPAAGKIAADSKTGIILISDTMGKRLIKLMENGVSNNPENRIIELNKKASVSAGATAKKAMIYEELGSLEMAGELWEDALDADYNEEEAYSAMDRIEIEILKASVRRMKDKTLATASDLGRESARQYYSKTIQLYEKLLSIAPENNGIRKEKMEFEELFNRQKYREKEKELLTVEKFSVSIFPSLIQYYTSKPAGSITISNADSRNIEINEISVFIRDFMDFPSTKSVKTVISPGEKKKLDIYTFFNRSILDLEEDLPVTAGITITYTGEGGQGKLEKAGTVLLHRRSAISWSDSGRIASFITPNENSIEIFSHNAVSVSCETEKSYSLLPKKLLQALRISEALSIYGITYTADPDSPAESVIGFPEKIDTVRFPRKTLLIHSGDCDDSTALLASLLESGGIETAVITSPGHVFLAFNTGEPNQNKWMFTTPERSVITYRGTLWIPLETTVLNGGFMKAWSVASKEYERFSPLGKTEFLPVRKLWEVYPPVPLKKSIYSVVIPAGQELAAAISDSFSGIGKNLYEPVLEELELEKSGAAGRKLVLVKNRIGILHARFGNFKNAEREFKECINSDPRFNPAYINLVNLYKVTGDNNNLNRIIDQIKTGNPDLGTRLAESAGNGDSSGDSSIIRASGSEDTVVWESEQIQ